MISDIERVKQEQDILNEVLSKKIKKAKSLPLIGKSQILTEMLSVQDKISKTTLSMKMLDERLDALQKVKEDETSDLPRLDVDEEISTMTELHASPELGQEIATQLVGGGEVAGGTNVREVGQDGATKMKTKMKKRPVYYNNECPFCNLQCTSRESLKNH